MNDVQAVATFWRRRHLQAPNFHVELFSAAIYSVHLIYYNMRFQIALYPLDCPRERYIRSIFSVYTPFPIRIFYSLLNKIKQFLLNRHEIHSHLFDIIPSTFNCFCCFNSNNCTKSCGHNKHTLKLKAHNNVFTRKLWLIFVTSHFYYSSVFYNKHFAYSSVKGVGSLPVGEFRSSPLSKYIFSYEKLVGHKVIYILRYYH